MKLNKLKKIILSLAVVIFMILAFGQSVIYAATQSLTAKLEVFRRLPVSSDNGITQEATQWGFELYMGGHPVYQISEVDSDNKFIGENSRLYCLNATEGTTWDTNAVGTNLSYDTKTNLKNATEVNETLKSNSVYDISKYEYYSSIVWLLDNFYMPNITNKEDFLANTGIVKGELEDSIGKYNTYYYDESINSDSVFSDSKEDINIYSQLYGNPYGKGGYGYRTTNNEYKVALLPDEMIETVQQAVIWYFTNYLDNNTESTETFNCYTSKEATSVNSWLYYTLDGANYYGLSNSENGYKVEGNNVGAMYQEQAAILYNYLVDKALEAKEKGYTGAETTASISIDCATNAIKKQTNGTYKIGPIKIETKGTVSEIVLKVNNSDGSDITTTCTIPSSIPVEEEFYIEVPSTVDGNIIIQAAATGNSTEQTLWTKTGSTEQPIVEINRGENDIDADPITITNEKEFDLKLVKYISAINGNTSKGKKVTKIDTTKLAAYKSQTADYTLSKDVITVQKGDYVTYTFRVYNEGELDGYLTKLTDNIPLGLQFVQTSLKNDGKTITVYSYDGENGLTSTEIEVDEETYKLVSENNAYWTLDQTTNGNLKLDTYDGDTTPSISLDIAGYLGGTNKLLKAYDSSKDTNNNGDGLDYVTLTVVLKVGDTASYNKIIRNEAAITGHTDKDGNSIKDRDSEPENWYGKDDHDRYQDDEDFDNVRLIRFDLALRKFITAISADSNIEASEYLDTRAPKVDTSKLKSGKDFTAIYNHPKDAITVNAGDYVLYTIRVYNEGDIDGYASKITDYLPDYLNYIDGEINQSYGWVYNQTDRSVTTTYLSSANGTSNKLEAFDKENDNGSGSELDYKEVKILCRVSSNAIVDQNITNIAEITEYQYIDENNRVITEDIDTDSNPENLEYPQDVPGYEGNRDGDNASTTYYPGQEDDDDFEKVKVKEPDFDLALRKFITDISGEEVTTRIPEVSFEDGKITYTHPKDVVKVVVGDTVTYTIRVFNEGKTAGFAQTVTDDIPEYLEYLPENETNITYRWKMYDKDGKETEDVTKADKIVTDYTSKAYGEELMTADETLTENPNLLSVFDASSEISDTNPEYVDVKVAFKVKDPNSSKYIIKNKAQISEDADENGNPVIDIDSIPNKWNDGEDDQDYENVSVEYFDLALLKYVSEVEVTEKGTTTITKTGNKGDKNDIIPKVEIHKKKLDSTTVKFIYTIKVTNEGDIPGYVKELTDYVPEGLEFNTEDNKGWEEKEDGIIVTELLSDTLLNPGESAKVKVTFRWINDEDNLGVKTNIAEISKDDNEKGIPDRDSTPGNKKDGEDDIDDADVLLSIKTGMAENIIIYMIGATVILLVLASGVILIKKFVL